jgi:CheY-like chemotaxis protein
VTSRDFEPSRHSILVIEDDRSDRGWLFATLDGAGYAVEAAANGAEAIRKLDSHRFDAVTLDLLLPDMSGWDILRHIREKSMNRDVPVVIVTVMADEGVGIAFTISGFLEKPADRKALLETLSRAGVTLAGKATVLLVDDNEVDLALYQVALKDCGLIINAHSSAAEALRAAAEKLPDIVVLDLVMPDIDGFEFMRRFRELDGGKAVPVIVLTAKDLVGNELEALRPTVLKVVHKGAGSVEALLAEVKAVLSVRDAVVRVEAAISAEASGQPNREAQATVLVVEDEEVDRQHLIRILTQSGYAVYSAARGGEALELLGKQLFRAVLVDLMLPDMSGWDLVKRMHCEGINQATPVLMTTVVADKSAGLSEPINDYLLKPIDPKRLLASLAAIGVGPRAGKRILVVDDELKTAMLLEPALREWGYEPIFADSGEKGLELVQRQRPLALIVDLMKPEMSGYEFLKRLREELTSELPVIIMTARDMSREDLTQIKTLAQMVVEKGAGGTLDLLEALRECLGPITGSN